MKLEPSQLSNSRVLARLSSLVTACLLVTVCIGCGSKAASVPVPTRDQAIAGFQQTATEWFDRMASQPATAAAQLELLTETIEARQQTYGEPFASYLVLVKEIRSSWDARPTPKAVQDGITRLRDATRQLLPKK
jgi:hypothetical protein